MSSKLPELKQEWEITGSVRAAAGGSTLASHQNSMWYLKETLIGFTNFPWTVHSSSNGVNYSGDGQTLLLPIPDESSNNNVGILTGIEPSNITSDIPGGLFSTLSMTFNTTDEFVSMGNVSELAFERTDSFSISFWFRKNAGGTTTAVSKQTTGLIGYSVLVENTGEISVNMRNGVGSRIVLETDTGGFDDDVWHHVAFTYNGNSDETGVTIYVDGSLEVHTASVNTLDASILTTNAFNVSGYGNGTGEFGGQIDDVAVYDKELTSGEVTTIYNAGAPNDLRVVGPTANLVGYWLMGEGLTVSTPIDTWFTSVNLIWEDDGTAHSWIVLQHPIRNVQFCLNCNRAGTSGRHASMYVSFGGNYTGGDLTDKAMAVDEIRAGIELQWLGPLTGAYSSWVHGWQSTDGKRTRVYIATSVGTGEGGFYLFDEIDTPSPLWEQKEIALIAMHGGVSGGSIFDTIF